MKTKHHLTQTERDRIQALLDSGHKKIEVARIVGRPKGTDINNYSKEYLEWVKWILNNKPRKSLNYRTPLEIMMENNL